MLSPLVTLEDQAVLRNLATALEEELRTYAAYKAYARKADEEGLLGLGSLFRAAARAEQIHANSHARVIRRMGAEPPSDIPEPQVESSFENLRAAMVNERFETDYLYPTVLTSTAPLLDSAATRSFQWALEGDKSHVRLLSDAMARFNTGARTGWDHQRHDFFVCGLCGYTAQSHESENCPSCNLIWERFETVQ
jgi:rubrerythrin